MRKVDSILRAINRRAKEVGDFFPLQSNEYQQIQAVLGAIPGISALKIFPKGKPAQLSRSKKVIKKIEESSMLYAQLNQALDIILSFGTVKQMAERYRETMFVMQKLTAALLLKMQTTTTAIFPQTGQTDFSVLFPVLKQKQIS